VGKVNGKSPISTGFLGISSVFADIYPIFLVFGLICLIITLAGDPVETMYVFALEALI